MTWLEICQAVVREAGLGLSGPTSTVSQTGELLNVVTWALDSWNEIQAEWKWDFLWESTTVTILDGTSSLAGSIPADRYIKDQTFNDTARLTYMPYPEFRNAYTPGTIVAGVPSVWTIQPDKAFKVNAIVSGNTALTVQRYKNPVAPSGSPNRDTYEPELPSKYHMLIVWRAVMRYAGHDEAGALYQHAKIEHDRLYRMATNTEKPALCFGGGW